MYRAPQVRGLQKANRFALLGLQSRFGDKPFRISSSLSSKRDCGPKRLTSGTTTETARPSQPMHGVFVEYQASLTVIVLKSLVRLVMNFG